MILENLLNRGSMPVLQQMMCFTEARHEVLANNISNFDTVGYKMKDLAVEEFCSELRDAVQRRKSKGAGTVLEMRGSRNLSWDRNNRLKARPIEIKDNNILFQDGNNRFVEKQMIAMAKNAMIHNLSAELLKGKYSTLKMAISGRL